MTRLHRFGVFIACIAFFVPISAAQNFARYRDFEFGMSVGSVAKQTETDVSTARTIHTLPGLVQTLQWYQRGAFSPLAAIDPVRSIRFDFYDDQLFKIVASYGTKQLEGLSADDLIEGISSVYGPPSRPAETVLVSAYKDYEDRQKVIARWENAENSYSLFKTSYGNEFGLLVFSKKLDEMAVRSIRESERLDVLSAPQREVERQEKRETDRQAQEEKARLTNKPNFRP